MTTTADSPPQGTRQRLDHIDAMRPVKQSAVISTHVLIFFAPIFASAVVVGLAMWMRFARDAFMFVSACMLTYSYRDMSRVNLRTYWRRRGMAVGVPYLCWTVIYFFFTAALLLTTSRHVVPVWAHVFNPAGLRHFLFILCTGYYQLYYLLIIMQFYVLFPLLLPYLKRHPEQHGWIMLGAVAFQVFVSYAATAKTIAFPLNNYYTTRIALMYALYLVGGMIVALRLDATHKWVCSHARLVISLTLAAGLGSTLLLILGRSYTLPRYVVTGRSIFSAMAIPYNVGAIACLYIFGIYLVDRKRSLRTRAIVQSGSDNSYGVYLTQLLWIPVLVRIRHHLGFHVPWPIAVTFALVVTYGLGVIFTALVARTPLAKPLVGRSRATWRTLLPRRDLTPASLHEDTGDGPLDFVPEQSAQSGAESGSSTVQRLQFPTASQASPRSDVPEQ